MTGSEASGERASMPTLVDLTTADGRPRTGRSNQPHDCAVFIRMSGEEAGRVHPVTPEEMTLGRGRVCTIQFDDVTLSRVHARVVALNGQFVLEDCDSLNGCYVNDERVSRALLRDGDRVRLGSGASLRFQLVNADEEYALCRLYEASVRDGLTGLYNRKHLDERLAAEVSYALRHQCPLSIVMLDLDRFKLINDGHGHWPATWCSKRRRSSFRRLCAPRTP